LLPIIHLMFEHRLIERVINLVEEELRNMNETHTVNSKFIDSCTDFLKYYSARCHEGKEVGFLFRDLSKKDLLVEHYRIMQELIAEHLYMRKTINSIVKANEDYELGNLGSLIELMKLIEDLITIYPRHIEKRRSNFSNLL